MWADRGPCSIALVPVRSYINEGPSEIVAYTYPDTLHVKGDTIGRDAFVVRRLENVVFPGLVCEATTQPIDICLEHVWSEEFMGECREREIEVVF